ncbi:MAG TPA: hypothetical protein VNA69_23935 [Thermoanaerobaculia bacterium]|nr:hypothetical protein [Thermoanaerobaculia bacterium]
MVGPELLAGQQAPPRSIATGFAPFDFDPAGPGDVELWLTPAERIGAADRAFLRHGARISMYGVSGGEARSRGSLAFDVHYTVSEGGVRREVLFHAWAGGGGPIRFVVPLDHEDRIRFSVTAVMPASQTRRRSRGVNRGKTQTSPSALALELSLDGPIRLQRGFYVIVPLLDGQSAPGWWEYAVRKVNGRWGVYSVAGTPAPFEHFVVRVDHAAAPAAAAGASQ